MFVVGQGIDGRDAPEPGEVLNLGLREGTDNRAVDHAAEHARRVLNGFTPPILHLAGGKKKRLAAQFADPHLEGNARPGRRLGEDHGPGLAAERLFPVPPTLPFHPRRLGQDLFQVDDGEFLDAQ